MSYTLLSTQILNWTSLLYFIAMVLFFVLFALRRRVLGTAAMLFAGGGLLLHTTAIAIRWFESYQQGYGHAPMSNMYESVVFFSWSIVLLLILIDWRYRQRVIGVFVMPFALFSLVWAQLFTVAVLVGGNAGGTLLGRMVV
ncbi:MAG TPA: hypothetical protein PL053_09715, partial [Deltaproteobacteria bacterium]|nr:hypothetical protein [Deltaproteobacteria bacterium]